MKKKILISVNTEYHLLLAVNQLFVHYSNTELFDVEIILPGVKISKRLSHNLDFSHLPAVVSFVDEDISIYRPLDEKTKLTINYLLSKRPDCFLFFQEQDILMVILSNYFFKANCEVLLIQDGLKPYAHLKYHSLGLMLHNHKQNLWLKRNGFEVQDWFSPIWSKKYGFVKSISKLLLTYPEAYNNWNYREIEKIEMLPLEFLNKVLRKLFRYEDLYMPDFNGVFFYINQPMKEENDVEVKFIRELSMQHPSRVIYIKLHPLTPSSAIEKFKEIDNVRIISVPIPAELFIMNLTNSIIISVSSTALLLNNSQNKFFYLYKIFEKDIRRLSRWEIRKSPAKHIKVIHSINEINFY